MGISIEKIICQQHMSKKDMELIAGSVVYMISVLLTHLKWIIPSFWQLL